MFGLLQVVIQLVFGASLVFGILLDSGDYLTALLLYVAATMLSTRAAG